MKNIKDLRLPPLKKRERSFEWALRDALVTEGIMFVKLKPTITGFPDRLAIFRGRMELVELKREGEDLEPHQTVMHNALRRMGVEVLVVHGPDVKRGVRIIKQWMSN